MSRGSVAWSPSWLKLVARVDTSRALFALVFDRVPGWRGVPLDCTRHTFITRPTPQARAPFRTPQPFHHSKLAIVRRRGPRTALTYTPKSDKRNRIPGTNWTEDGFL
eukprot:1136165-Rhodomonas_salina.1